MFTQTDPTDQTTRPHALMVLQDANTGEILGAFTLARKAPATDNSDASAQQR